MSDYHVILAEVDGHSERTGELVSVEKNCDEIEDYVLNNLSGNLYCLSGFSMGATMAVEIIGRGNINVTKTHLDAAFLTKIGLLTKPYEYIFCKAIERIQNGKEIPKYMMLFWRGSNEQYPKKSVTLLKKYLPAITDVEIEHMGHGQ